MPGVLKSIYKYLTLLPKVQTYVGIVLIFQVEMGASVLKCSGIKESSKCTYMKYVGTKGIYITSFITLVVRGYILSPII